MGRKGRKAGPTAPRKRSGVTIGGTAGALLTEWRGRGGKTEGRWRRRKRRTRSSHTPPPLPRQFTQYEAEKSRLSGREGGARPEQKHLHLNQLQVQKSLLLNELFCSASSCSHDDKVRTAHRKMAGREQIVIKSEHFSGPVYLCVKHLCFCMWLMIILLCGMHRKELDT